MIDQMTYPVMAWCVWNGKTRYVSHVPGNGGVDWGYTNRAAGNERNGKIYDKALPLSKHYWQRFASDCRKMNMVAYCAPFTEHWHE